MSEQETIERGALAYVNFVRSEKGFPLVASLDGFLPEDRAGYIAHVSAVFAALRPGDVLLGGMVVEQGWQTMETAPKDGGSILATGGGLGPNVDLVRYNTRIGCWNATDVTLDDRDNEPDGYSRPTHWRPLPAAPKGGA